MVASHLPDAVQGPGPVDVVLDVHGAAHVVRIEPRVALLDCLRHHMRLPDATERCDHGACGACTVWVDTRPVLACLTLAIACEGRAITTAGSGLHRWTGADATGGGSPDIRTVLRDVRDGVGEVGSATR
jgi:xanthine dehydrogenase YagT iron-sulfur-binding subunit